MDYGINALSLVALRVEPSDKSELISQILYGETFTILEQNKTWVKIRLSFDDYEGWIDKKQYISLTESDYNTVLNSSPKFSTNLVDYITLNKEELQSIVLGSNANATTILNHKFSGDYINSLQSRKQLIQMALKYINTPYLWGGKSPFGIDCSGFTQMVYKICGYNLKRDANQQATQGHALSFIEESKLGDLAFFDNDLGEIVHVGIMMPNNYIIHAHGKVRVDKLDHTGIFNINKNKYSHKLRVIKTMI